jgi:hypothetical protein
MDYKHYIDISRPLIQQDVKYPFNLVLHFNEYVTFGKIEDGNFKAHAVRRGIHKVMDDKDSLDKFNNLFSKFDIKDLSETDFDILTLELGILFS